MKKKILAGLLLAGSTMFAAPRVSFGVSVSELPVVVVAASGCRSLPCPGPGYVFVNGYWQFQGGDRDWRYNYRRDDDRRAPERVEHLDRHAEHFRR